MPSVIAVGVPSGSDAASSSRAASRAASASASSGACPAAAPGRSASSAYWIAAPRPRRRGERGARLDPGDQRRSASIAARAPAAPIGRRRLGCCRPSRHCSSALAVCARSGNPPVRLMPYSVWLARTIAAEGACCGSNCIAANSAASVARCRSASSLRMRCSDAESVTSPTVISSGSGSAAARRQRAVARRAARRPRATVDAPRPRRTRSTAISVASARPRRPPRQLAARLASPRRPTPRSARSLAPARPRAPVCRRCGGRRTTGAARFSTDSRRRAARPRGRGSRHAAPSRPAARARARAARRPSRESSARRRRSSPAPRASPGGLPRAGG